MKNSILILVSLFTFSALAMDTPTEPTDTTAADTATLDESEFRNEIIEMMEPEGFNDTTTPVVTKQTPGKREAKVQSKNKTTTPDTSTKQ